MANADDTAPEWRVIPDFEDYEISSIGEVRRRTGTIHAKFSPGYHMKVRINSDGYAACSLTSSCGAQKTLLVHRLVCAAFNGPPPEGKPVCAHGNGNISDNSPGNLRWATHQENSDDMRRHGTIVFGEAHARAKISAGMVRRIRTEHGLSGDCRAVSIKLGVPYKTVYHIVKGRTWRHLD